MEGIEKIEDDSEVKEQIDGKSQQKNGEHEISTVEKEDTKPKSEENGASSESAKAAQETGSGANGDHTDAKKDSNETKTADGSENTTTNGDGKHEKNAFDEVKSDVGEVKEAAKKEGTENVQKIETNNDSVVEDAERKENMPSSILEKGVIYFFFRGRVGIEDAQGVDDIARSYIVLRPLPLGAKLGDGPLEDAGNARLLALPKKVLPKSGRDRFLMFVEKVNTSVRELKESFISGSEYSTKTSGTSNVPAATPIAEGIYAITTTGRESHLAYHVTVPEIGEVQKDLGINEKGSYVLSVKNPTASGPANATLDNPAEYPESIMKDFRGLRWTPLKPEHLDYERTQFLLIGEGQGSVEQAVQESDKDKKEDNTSPEDELNMLEEEDTRRVEHLSGDDSIFADLGLSSKEYPKMSTTW